MKEKAQTDKGRAWYMVQPVKLLPTKLEFHLGDS